MDQRRLTVVIRQLEHDGETKRLFIPARDSGNVRNADLREHGHRINLTGPTGRVLDIKVLSGHPLLAPAAIEAVKQWVYQPFVLNGAAVDVVSTVALNFALTE